HLAALRAAAAVVAARAEPSTSTRRKRPQSVWVLLPRVEPALAEWAAFFAAGASKRAAAEAGLPAAASGHEADDLLRDAETFVSLAESTLGVPSGQTLLPLRTAAWENSSAAARDGWADRPQAPARSCRRHPARQRRGCPSQSFPRSGPLGTC